MSRPGSSASSMFGSAHTVNRRLLDSPGTLDVLPPDDEFTDQDSDIAIEDLDDGSDSFSEFTDDEIQQLSAARSSRRDNDDHQITKQLVISGFDPNIEEEEEIDSEEENEIVKDIKEEIKRQVKEEMKTELEVYQQKPNFDDQPGDDGDLGDIDPDLKAAILKMRKYDRILKKKMKREKEVKRDRMKLQKRLREELDTLKNEAGKTEPREETSNTARFLALAPPPSHNEGVTLNSEDESPPVTPVFRTQPPDVDDKQSDPSQSTPEAKSTSRKSNNSRQTDTSLGSSMNSRASNSDRKQKRKKDFIKRNIKLASDAGNVIAMTDDEKNRLEDLLKDVDSIQDIPEEQTDRESMLDIALPPGIGFRPEVDEEQHLKDIDNRLKALLPPEEFNVYTAQVTVNPLNHCLFTRTDLRNIDIDVLGEQVLKETKEQREMRLRLEQIESDLAELGQHKDLVVETQKLSDETLNSLIEDCCRSLSRTTLNSSLPDTARSTSSRLSVLENLPRLPTDILEDLLAEARAEQGSSFAQQILEADDDIIEENESDELKAKRIIRNMDNDQLTNNRGDLNVESLTDDQIQELLRQSMNGTDEIHPKSNSVKLPEINLSGSLVSQSIDYNNTPTRPRTGDISGERPPTRPRTGEISGERPPTRSRPDEISGERPPTRPRTRERPLSREASGEMLANRPSSRGRYEISSDRPLSRGRSGEMLANRPPSRERYIDTSTDRPPIRERLGISRSRGLDTNSELEYRFTPHRPDTGDGPRQKSRQKSSTQLLNSDSDDDKPW